VKRLPRRIAQAAPALLDVPLFMAEGQAFEQLRTAAIGLRCDPVRSQRILSERQRARLRPRADVPSPSGFFFFFAPPSEEPTADGIAIIKVSGSLYRGFFWDDYASLRARVDEAMDDAKVRAVLLDIDSPGGQVAGLFDLTRHLFALRSAATKPFWAIADDSATSAAYAIASTAQRVFTTPTAVTGSIGARVMHIDQSEYNRQLGVTITEVASGARKTDLSSYKPLNARGLATLKELVGQAAEQFFAEVSRHRPALTVEVLRAQEAGVFIGTAAVEAGLVDAVANLDEVLDELREEIGASRASASALPSLSSPTTAATTAGEDPMNRGTPHPAAASPGAAAPTAAAPTAAAAASATDPALAPAAVPVAAAPAPAPSAPAPAAADPLAEERVRARLITNACTLAGRPELAGEMIASGLTLPAAQDRLLAISANRDAGLEVHGTLPGSGAGAPTGALPRIDVHAVYRRWNDPVAVSKPAASASR
jgi:capsid assembly protease